MERVDRRRICLAIYPFLLERARTGLSPAGVERVVAAAAEGYPFPADLDHDQPTDGMAPASMASLMCDSLTEGVPVAELAGRFDRRFGPVESS